MKSRPPEIVAQADVVPLSVVPAPPAVPARSAVLVECPPPVIAAPAAAEPASGVEALSDAQAAWDAVAWAAWDVQEASVHQPV